MNAKTNAKTNAVALFEQNYPQLVSRGIEESTWNAITQTIFPGCNPDSALMAVDYCRSREIDILMKPVHIVPMWMPGKNGQQGGMRDVVMPGIGLYRIQADRSGNYAGNDEPVFGPMVEAIFGSQTFKHPEFCIYTVYKMIGGNRVAFTAKEYWIENYASKSRNDAFPNAMWGKRPMAQLAKCTEAQALRKAWPEIGSQPTYEEMEGKEIDVTPQQTQKAETESSKLIGNGLRSKQKTEDKPVKEKTVEKEIKQEIKKEVAEEKSPESKVDTTQASAKIKDSVADDTAVEEFTPYDEVYDLVDRIKCKQSAKDAGQSYKQNKDKMSQDQRKTIYPVLKAALIEFGLIKA